MKTRNWFLLPEYVDLATPHTQVDDKFPIGTAPARRWFFDPLRRLMPLCLVWLVGSANGQETSDAPPDQPRPGGKSPREYLDDPWIPGSEDVTAGGIAHCGPWDFGPYRSFQVNVNAQGCNVRRDAANEPSIALDPNLPTNLIVGWRQFDDIQSNFRQAGVSYTFDGGQTWAPIRKLQPTVFRSDPVLDYDRTGIIYYYSLKSPPGGLACDLFRSTDGGITWLPPVPAYGGDKNWMVVDRTRARSGLVFCNWRLPFGCCFPNVLTRSTNRGGTFAEPVTVPGHPGLGTMTIGPDGELYIAGVSETEGKGSSDVFVVSKSINAFDPLTTPLFTLAAVVDLGGGLGMGGETGPNPEGLLGQVWIAADLSGESRRGHLYILASVDPPGADPLDVMFTRSEDYGRTWSPPVRVDDAPSGPDSWQWFGTMSVSPSGRIDAFWNDTRVNSDGRMSQLHYSFSLDGGRTWSPGAPVSGAWDHFVGFPNQGKIGDYYHSRSDLAGVSIAYAATFNNEQDVYYLRIPFNDCNSNGLLDYDDIQSRRSDDRGGNRIPDECECAMRPTLGNADNDCDVDLRDWRRMTECLDGPDATAGKSTCDVFDIHVDQRITLRDVAGFQNRFTIP